MFPQRNLLGLYSFYFRSNQVKVLRHMNYLFTVEVLKLLTVRSLFIWKLQDKR